MFYYSSSVNPTSTVFTPRVVHSLYAKSRRRLIDDVSGKRLNNALVEKARTEELEVIDEIGVWKVIDRPANVVILGTR